MRGKNRAPNAPVRLVLGTVVMPRCWRQPLEFVILQNFRVCAVGSRGSTNDGVMCGPLSPFGLSFSKCHSSPTLTLQEFMRQFKGTKSKMETAVSPGHVGSRIPLCVVLLALVGCFAKRQPNVWSRNCALHENKNDSKHSPWQGPVLHRHFCATLFPQKLTGWRSARNLV